MKKYEDIVEVLFNLRNEEKGITVIYSEDDEKYISYKDLWGRASYLVELLYKKGYKKGDEAIIQCSNLEKYLYSFWACMIGGFIAVPVDSSSAELISYKMIKKLNDPFILFDCDEDRYSEFDYLPKKKVSVKNINFNSVNNEDFSEFKNVTGIEEVIYIQFSSGSTGEPHGVIINKKNISSNINSIIRAYYMDENDRTLSWQSLTHCFGLTTYHLLPIFLGVNQYLIDTQSYILSPLIWMNKVNKYRATRLGTIPFALKLFCDVYENSKEVYDWDLSCIKSIIIGAEQVNIKVYNDFTTAMNKYNCKPTALLPGYGLSEATTIVSLVKYDTIPKIFYIKRGYLDVGTVLEYEDKKEEDKKEEDNISFVEMGIPIDSLSVDIQDDDGKSLGSDCIGHICVKGDSVTIGYYNDAKGTEAVKSKDGWLNTGDLGFIADGKLVLIGRDKEIVVLKGKKYSCNDLESILAENIINNDYGTAIVVGGINSESLIEEVIVFVECSDDLSETKNLRKFLNYSNNVKEIMMKFAKLEIGNVIPINKIPKTFSGKIKRKKLSDMYCSGQYKGLLEKLMGERNIMKKENEEMNVISKKQIKDIVVDIIEGILKFSISDYDLPFKDYGIKSVNIPIFTSLINERLNVSIPVSAIFSNPNLNSLVEYIYKCMMESEDENVLVKKCINEDDDKIAIIGMSCRFPGGANDIKAYWDLLVSGKDGVVDIPEDRWEADKYYDDDENVPGKMYCKKGGFLEEKIDEFDAKFFNISPKEATALDPQQRLLLELTWEAVENANMDMSKLNGSNTGVYLGISSNEYTLGHLYSGDLSKIDAYSLTGTCMSTACGRVAYTFGFEGPCLAVDTACSSVLTALHLAHTAVKNKEADMAVVAGVNLMISPVVNISFSKLKATSKDGHSKAFDAAADGYGRGEGGGVIILKRLKDAVRDNDNILGVISGTGINQDGKSNGLTAPNGESQSKLITNTLDRYNLSPLDIDYVEMHGTGTKLGDPIEVNEVAKTYGKGRDANNPLLIGSVKSNIGHLEAAAGMASIIKTLLSMKKNIIPANLNFHTPNPFINWSELPIKVVNKQTEWKKQEGKVRRAAINGFGFGGSNAHVILEEYSDKKEIVNVKKQDGIKYMLKISAKSEYSLKEEIKNYIDYLKECNEEELIDVVYSADRGREDFEYRFIAMGETRDELLDNMNSYISENYVDGALCSIDEENKYIKDRKVVFMFTGQGSQYINMGKLLYETNEVFREAMNKCDKLFKPYILKSLVAMIYGENADSKTVEKTIYAQPLIFSIEYSLYKLWEHYGVKPEIVMGHSIGEYVAAVVSEIIALEDAVKLVSIRGRLMDSAPGSGSMGTIFASEEVTTELISAYEGKVVIAACNAEETCVISGETEYVDKVLQEATAKGLRAKKLKVSHAFHSQLMEPILEEFREIAKEIKYSTPKVRFISALYNKEIDDNQILDDEYWTKHIRGKVDFYGAIKSIKKPKDYVFMEVGAHRVLSSLCKLIFEDDAIIVSSLNIKKNDFEQIAECLARLYVSGVNIDWDNVEFYGCKNYKKVMLPNYVYDKKRYWNELVYDCKNIASNDNYDRLLGEKIESPCMNNSVVYQSIFTSTKPYFMKEHIIFDTPISPAAAHVSMILSAMKEIKHPASCSLEEIEFRAPLAVNDDEQRKVQICIKDVKEDNTSFEIYSKDLKEADSEWLVNSVGKVSTSDEIYKEDVQANIDEFKAMEYEEDVENKVYALMLDSGFNLGDSFRRIRKTSYKDGEGICYIAPLNTIPDLDMYELYPGIIDSIFQTGLSIVFDELIAKYNYKESKQTIIPYYMGKLTYNYRKSKNLYCHTKANVKEDVIYADIEVYNEQGELIMEIRDSLAKITNRSSLLKEVKANYSNLFYQNDWIESHIEMNNNDSENCKYLVITNNIEKGELISEKLIERNKEVNVVSWQKYNLDSIVSENIKQYKLIYLVSRFSDEEDYTSSLFNALKLVQEIGEKGLYSKVKLKLLTEEVQEVGGIDNINITDAALWGFSKVISIEYQQIFNGIVDIDSNIYTKSLDKLIDEIILNSNEEICLRSDGTRYVSRLVRNNDFIKKYNNQLKKIEVSEEYSYLITGGTGALGMTYVDFLVSRGAKNIILMCRREPNERVQGLINKFRDKGINIVCAFADVSKQDDVLNELNRIQLIMPKIKGVVHAAGVLDDRVIQEQTIDLFTKVLAPKVYGTVNVFNALKDNNLDFFVMLSSITSILGNMGQSNYAAANYFMNRFAVKMQKNGNNIFALCWGPWDGSGMASGNEITSKNMDSMGLNSFNEEVGEKIISTFFDKPSVNIVIADINWSKLKNNFIGAGKQEFLEKITVEDSKEESMSNEKNDNTILIKLKEINPEDRKEYLMNELQVICGKIMGFDKNELLSTETSFKEQGADSLMIFSMRTVINKALNTDINVSTFFNYPTLDKLSEYLIDEILFFNEEVDKDDEDISTEDLLAEFADLTEN